MMNEFILINNLLKEYGDMREGIKNLKTCGQNTEIKYQKNVRTKNGRIMLL